MRNEKPKNELVGRAIAFSARAHDGQLRKDNKTPYISHPFRVSLVVRNVFEESDERILAAAVLHDTIEDTRTDRDDLIEEFKEFGEIGLKIADWVNRLSKDKRLVEKEREEEYAKTLSEGPDEVKIVKLADIYDNSIDSGSLPDDKREKNRERARFYLKAINTNSSPRIQKFIKIVEELLESGGDK